MRTSAVRTRRGLRASLLAVLVLVSAGVMFGLSAGPAFAAVVVVTDAQGVNDEPGQKDLTRFTFDDASPAGTLLVTINHDLTGLSGNNTGDACFLFDSDLDLKANYALCITFTGSPAVLGQTRLFTCGDDSTFKCTQPEAEVTGFASSCSVLQSNTDPFTLGDKYPLDTTTSCTLVFADVAGGDGVLIDVCSYPSFRPNSDPSDCILHGTSPTAVSLKAFTASASPTGAVLGWRTASEAGTLGFNVYRVEAGKRVKLNRALIASKGATRGGVYRFVDRTGKVGSRYWLQEVTRRGARSWVAAASVSRST